MQCPGVHVWAGGSLYMGVVYVPFRRGSALCDGPRAERYKLYGGRECRVKVVSRYVCVVCQGKTDS